MSSPPSTSTSAPASQAPAPTSSSSSAVEESKSESSSAASSAASTAGADDSSSSSSSPEAASKDACQHCGKASGLCCVKCKSAVYCSKACQKADWPKHKSTCGKGPNTKEHAEFAANVEAALASAMANIALSSGAGVGGGHGSSSGVAPYDVEFVDAQAMHAAHPATFDAPSRADLRAVRVGSMVKVSCNGERFWVTVTRVRGQEVSGTISNVLVCEQPFDSGDLIHFQKKNIFDIQQPGE